MFNMFKKILLAATPQLDAKTAPKAAFDLARAHGSELIIYHALPIGDNDWCPTGGCEDLTPFVERAEARIEAFYADELKDLDYTVRVETGPSHDKLMRIIPDEQVDLVVMGHHTAGKDRPDRMWGSVDTAIRKVCANTHCPVLVVTDPAPCIADLKRVLFAADFSTPSESALCYAASMARALETDLELFHVLDVGEHCPNPKYYMQDMNVFIDEAKSRMERRFSRMVEGIDSGYDAWEGIPYTEILKKARWSDADLLVLGQYSEGHELTRPFVGSTVIQVALSPGCPTLIVNYRPRTCV